MSRQFVKDFFQYIPSGLVPGIISFISIPVITRIFSPAEYGMYSLVMSAIYCCLVIINWLPVSITRFYPQYENDNRLDCFKWNIIFSVAVEMLIILPILFLLLIINFKNEHFEIFLAAGFLFLGFILFNVLQYVLRSSNNVNVYSNFASLRSVLSVSIGLAAIFLFDYGIQALFWGGVIAFIVIIPWQWKYTFNKNVKYFSKVDFNLLKELLKYGLPVIITTLSLWVLSFADRYIIQLFKTSREVGLYAANYNIVEFTMTQAVTMFMLACGPLAIRAWENDGIEGSKTFLTNTTRFLLLFGIPMTGGLSVLSRPISALIIGSSFESGHYIIPFVAMGLLFYGIQHQYNLVFQFVKKTFYITYYAMIAGGINILLNIIFIPKYSYFAAAVITTISYFLLLIIIVIASRKYLKWDFPFLSFFKIIAATVIMMVFVAISIKYIQAPLVITVSISILLGIIVYIISIILLNEIKDREKEFIISKLKIRRFNVQ
ncbi:MAG: lipopolysaccharide biosynthesis protein [Candidatus Aureabacteria bacterium]|nr:lipopolysaccharide biosynthesis protein [Candidatus Auribacterota bacterium]